MKLPPELRNVAPVEQEMMRLATEHGWQLLPVKPAPEKAPLSPRGFKNASSSPSTIRRWGKTWPGMRAGLATGSASGVYAIDVDPKHGGNESLAALEREIGPLPKTVEQRTLSGGRHLIFRCPDGVELRSSIGKLGDGLDVRADGGYVVLYQDWINSPFEIPAADAPPELLERLTSSAAKDTSESPRSTLADLLADPPGEGRRNVWLAQVAGHYARLIHNRASYEATVRLAANDIESDDFPADEIDRTIRSIWESEQANVIDEHAATLPLLSIADLAARPKPTWHIDGMVPEGGFVVVYGPPASYKTFLLLDWMLCTAAGLPWYGCEVRRGSVVYIAAEGASGLYQRIEAWCTARNCEPPADFYVIPQPVNFLNKQDVEALKVILAAMEQPLSAIVADTMARCMSGGDENSVKDVGQVITALDEIARPYGATRYLAHHTGKSGDEERGSSALRGAADTMISTKPDGSGIKLVCDKQKDSEPFDPWNLHLEQTAQSAVLRLGTRSGQIGSVELQMLDEFQRSFGTQWAGVTAMKEACAGPKTSYYRSRKALIDGGFLELENDSRTPRCRLTELGLSRVPTSPNESHGTRKVSPKNPGSLGPGLGTRSPTEELF